MIFVVLALAVSFQVAHGNEVYPGVTVGDVEVGGMSKDAAMVKLRPWLGQRASEPIAVRSPERETKVTATELGATFDAAAAVEAAYAVGRTGNILENFGTQLKALSGGYKVEAPGLRLDRAKLASVIAQWGQAIDRPVKDTELKVTPELAVTATPSVIGRKLDQMAAVETMQRALAAGSVSVDLPVAETKPKVNEKDVEEARLKVAKLLSGPASLEFEGQRWTLSPKDISAALTIEQKAGTPAPIVTLKDDPIKKLVEKAGTEVDQLKVNARFDWNGGKLKLLKPGQDGRKVDRDKAVSLLTAAVSGDQRVVGLPVEVDKAAGNVDPSQLGIKEKIESATTSFVGAVPEKAHNIKTAASRLNGVLVAPGDIFSFNHEMGPTTLKSGFQVGFGIAITNGEMQTVPSVAGGICQVATTLLHTVFNAGYQIEERTPHAYWIQSYGLPPKGMVGLDATVDDPYLDFKFLNNTGNNLLIQADVQDSTLEFSFYGVKPKWKVEIDPPAISNVVKADPEMVRQDEPTWQVGRELWVERATDGMDVSITRRVIDNGDVRTLKLKSHYEPSRNVLMVGTAPAPTPTPAASGTPAPTKPQPTAPGTTPAPAKPQATAAPAPAKPGASPTPQR